MGTAFIQLLLFMSNNFTMPFVKVIKKTTLISVAMRCWLNAMCNAWCGAYQCISVLSSVVDMCSILSIIKPIHVDSIEIASRCLYSNTTHRRTTISNAHHFRVTNLFEIRVTIKSEHHRNKKRRSSSLYQRTLLPFNAQIINS